MMPSRFRFIKRDSREMASSADEAIQAIESALSQRALHDRIAAKRSQILALESVLHDDAQARQAVRKKFRIIIFLLGWLAPAIGVCMVKLYLAR